MARVEFVMAPKKLNRLIARTPGVKAVVLKEAVEIGVVAMAVLATVADGRGRHHIEVGQGWADGHINLEGVAPMTVEYGRKPHEPGAPGHQKAHLVMTRTFGLVN